MSLTSLDARLDGRVVATDLDRALQQLAEADRLRANAAVLLGGLDGAGLSRWLGYVSLERLVAHRTGCGNREARRLTKVAQHLDRFEATAAALLAGRIGWAQAEILTRAASGFSKAYANDEAELVASAEVNEVERLEQICRLWRARADAEAAVRDAEHRFNRRGVWLQFAFDGSCHGRLALDADGAEIVASALETRPDPITPYGEARSTAQRRADALVEICQTQPCGSARSDGTEDDARPAGRATVDVVIDVETLAGASGSVERIRAELDHGGPITGPGLYATDNAHSMAAIDPGAGAIYTTSFREVGAGRPPQRISRCFAGSTTP